MCKMSVVGNGITFALILKARSRIHSSTVHSLSADILWNSNEYEDNLPSASISPLEKVSLSSGFRQFYKHAPTSTILFTASPQPPVYSSADRFINLCYYWPCVFIIHVYNVLQHVHLGQTQVPLPSLMSHFYWKAYIQILTFHLSPSPTKAMLSLLN